MSVWCGVARSEGFPQEEVICLTCLQNRGIMGHQLKLVAFLLIFTTNFETLTDHGVSRVNYEVPRLSKLHEDV